MRSEEEQNLRSAGADSVYIGTLESFLQEHPFGKPVMTLGNPPYSLAAQHVMLLLDYLMPTSLIGFLLKLGFLGTKERANSLWKQGQLKYVRPILGRPNFVKSKNSKSSSDVNEYGLFIWEVGYSGPPTILFPHIRWKGKT